MRLNLGCNHRIMKGYVNVDMDDYEGVDLVADVSDLSALQDNSCSEIIASHIFEHFGHRRTASVLKEWNRVLRPGGKIYISVPDLDRALDAYRVSGLGDWIVNFLYGDQGYEGAFHYTVFNAQRLSNFLEATGFDNIKKIKLIPGIKDGCSCLVLTTDNQLVSLTMEATKAMPKKMISTFTIIKNEITFIRANILSIIDYVDEMVFSDGNSTDGTLEAIKHIQATHKNGYKIKLFENKDCKDLKEDYVRLFNWTIKQCEGEYVQFLHPDMIVTNPEAYSNIGKTDEIAYYVNMRSFTRDYITEIVSGRANWWKNIHRNSFGLHYWGGYGHAHEDMYNSDVTGDEHRIYADLKDFKYNVANSGINVCHYSESKTYERRLDKMLKSLITQHPRMDKEELLRIAKEHPRVTLKAKDNIFGKFEFKKGDWMPEILKEKEGVWKKIKRLVRV